MKEIRTHRHINMKGSAKKDVLTVLILQETETFLKLKTLKNCVHKKLHLGNLRQYFSHFLEYDRVQ
jgi:hypothetical protein